MIRINLLPHREENRKERRRQFFVTTGLMVALGGAVCLLVHAINVGNIERQEARNTFLKEKIAVLNRDIDAIKGLREQIDRLVARKQVIETLQSNRAETVHLFNELSARVPTGTFLTSVAQSGDKINLKGFAQSNARVSFLMSALNDSPLLGDSRVIKTQAVTLGVFRVYGFELEVYIEKTVPPNETASVPATTPKG